MRRPDNEPLLFDLPLDRPARDGDPEAEPELDRQPARSPRTPSGTPRSPRGAGRAASEPGLSALAPGSGALQAGASPAAPPLRRPRERASQPTEQPELATFTEPRQPALSAAREPQPSDAAAASATTADGRVSVGRRVASGAADLLVHLAVAVVALAGCRYLGVFPEVRDWPAFAVFLFSFSFLYTVVPLAFWGHTLGMTWAGLTTESAAGEPLSFDQTARRWLGALLTLVVLGLPLLLAVGGRSLADRLSGSRTLATPG
jgi:uncharacterized RDD family membrane protein YckC